MGDPQSTEAFLAFAETRVSDELEVPAAKLHAAALKWCRDVGKPLPAVGKTLAAALRRRGWQQHRTGTGVVWRFRRPRVVDAAAVARAEAELTAILTAPAAP